MKNKIKKEILDAISTIEIESTDFYHEFGGAMWDSAKTTKNVESKNYNITLGIREIIKWDIGGQDYTSQGLELEKIEIFGENSIMLHTITDNEIIKNLNY